MRLAARTLAEGRQERLDRRRRDRAAARTLREAYPGVQRLRLDLHFDGAKNVPASQKAEYTVLLKSLLTDAFLISVRSE